MTYHPTCHSLRGLHLGDRPTRLLSKVKGLELVQLPGAEECCGFGGTFAVKNPAVSAAMGADKVRNVAATGAEVLCAADNSCLMHIGGTLGRQRTGVRIMHLAEILADDGGGPHERHIPRHARTFPRKRRGSRTGLAAQVQPPQGHAHHPRQARRASSASSPTGRSSARPARRSRTTPCATSTATCSSWRRPSPRRAATCTGPRDADEANRIVADLVKATGETEVVKVKSMATQEIGLNEALAEQGITAYETDLAELIVQLGDDRPSPHPGPRDPPQPRPRSARSSSTRWPTGTPAPEASPTSPPRSPRPPGCTCANASCGARSAISGANFMVAETGTLVVLESEGNGRMCLTLPETLISVVGIEKLVPTWRDLEVFLQLLPRSSTGERMNPYTTHVDRRGRRARTSTWCCSTTAAPACSPTRSAARRCAASAARPA